MEQDLISKKDLLLAANISYGQLYRWKRKELIPEDWFIRKSTFTGQESFFPKDKILARIEKIKNMKEDLSLDDLADVFSPAPTDIALTKDEILDRRIASTFTLELAIEQCGLTDSFSFDQVLHIYLLDTMLQSGDISADEGKTLLQMLMENFPKLEGKNGELILIRKLGVFFALLITHASQVFFDQNTRVVTRLNLATLIEELKLKIGSTEEASGR